jgi:hypothetical protein
MDKYSDAYLQRRVNFWHYYYKVYGEKHSDDTADWKIILIYWDRIVNMVLSELEIQEHEVEPMSNRISALF